MSGRDSAHSLCSW